MQESDKTNADLIDAIKELSASFRKSFNHQERLEKMVAILTMVSIIIAGMQFIQSFAFSGNLKMIIWGITTLVAIGVFIWWLLFRKKS